MDNNPNNNVEQTSTEINDSTTQIVNNVEELEIPQDNSELEKTTNIEITSQPKKKKNNKGLIVVLILIILGLVGYITYDKVLKDKIFTKEETKAKEEAKNNDIEEDETSNVVEDNTNDLKNQIGTLSTDKDDSVMLSINGKNVTLTYNLLNNTDVGIHQIKFDSKILFKQGASNGIGDLSYQVFTASDNKQYLLVTYEQWGMFGILLDDNGEVLSKINEYSDDIDCYMFAKNNEKLISVEGNSVYYYKYKKDSYDKSSGLKLQEYKISIANNKISEILTGKEIDGTAGQCS